MRQAGKAFRRAFAGGQAALLALDFDGTLAAMAASPRKARLRPGLRVILRRLAKLPAVQVAVISGRSMADLRKKLGLPGLLLFSNHGLDCSRASLAPSWRQRKAWKRLARQAKGRLLPLLGAEGGSFLEDKGLDISLHVRGLVTGRRAAFLRQARLLLKGLPLDLRRGKMTLELRPRGAPGKGHALMAALRSLPRGALCFFAGDDLTDEDAFLAMEPLKLRGLSVKVGPGPSRAKLRLTADSLARLLAALHRERQQGVGHGPQ